MRILTKGITFTVPIGWKDLTSYEFEGRDGIERLLITYDEIDDHETASVLMTEKKKALKDYFEDSVTFFPAASTFLGSKRVEYHSFCYDEGKKILEFFTVILLDKNTSMLVLYRYPASRVEKYKERFVDILSSLVLDEGAGAKSTTGLEQAGRVWLVIPKHLNGPEFYRFANPEETMELFVRPGIPSSDYVYGTLIEETDATKALPLAWWPTGKLVSSSYEYVLNESQSESGEPQRIFRTLIMIEASIVDFRLSGPPDEQIAMSKIWYKLLNQLEID